MNEKGFSLVELITTFALSAVIIIILINLLLLIKNITYNSDTKTKLLIHQSELSNILNSKFYENNLIEYNTCNDSYFCYSFKFNSGETCKLIINDDSILFGNFIYKLEKGTIIEEPVLEKVYNYNSTTRDNFIVIRIPITHKLYGQYDFGINLVYLYNSNITEL